MHHHSTKQRLAALRRRLGIQLTPPKWARERSRKFKEAAVALRAARDEAARQIVAALTPAPLAEATPAGMFAVAGGSTEPGDAPTTVAEAPYPSQHLSATDAARTRPSGGGGDGDDGGGGGGSKRWLWIIVLVAIALGLVAWCGLSGKSEQAAPTPPPAPVQAVAPAPEPPPPPPPPPPAPKQLTVVKGDCLWNLAARHLGDAHGWRQLYEANRGSIRDPDLIFPGQALQLP